MVWKDFDLHTGDVYLYTMMIYAFIRYIGQQTRNRLGMVEELKRPSLIHNFGKKTGTIRSLEALLWGHRLCVRKRSNDVISKSLSFLFFFSIKKFCSNPVCEENIHMTVFFDICLCDSRLDVCVQFCAVRLLPVLSVFDFVWQVRDSKAANLPLW